MQKSQTETRFIMSRECAICGKVANKAHKISFSHKANVHRQVPNLQPVKAVIDGQVKKVKVCTSCIKANKVKKVV
ncbi:MAG: 50S ribosomal protein L28 [Candidatus Gastranaerophilales bacterium]|nr:50S ribosomal protein L28 [Candidatus Gastranaerophilales bacterium]